MNPVSNQPPPVVIRIPCLILAKMTCIVLAVDLLLTGYALAGYWQLLFAMFLLILLWEFGQQFNLRWTTMSTYSV